MSLPPTFGGSVPTSASDSTQLTPPDALEAAAELEPLGMAREFARLAQQLVRALVEEDAPERLRQAAEMLRRAADVIAQDLQPSSPSEIGLPEATRQHQLRNQLHQVYMPLQRLRRFDDEEHFARWADLLRALDQRYRQLHDLLLGRGRSTRPFRASPDAAVTDAAVTDAAVTSTAGAETAVADAAESVRPDTPNAHPTRGTRPAKPPSGPHRVWRMDSAASGTCQGGLPSLERPFGDSSARVLIVDDDWLACNTLEESLEDLGHVATSCRRPERVLDLLRQGGVDVCLLDLNMPGMSGWELLERIKSDPLTRDVAVIVVSGTERDESATRAIHLGADDFITKPVNFSLLSARITNCLARSQQHLRELARFLPLPVVDAIRRDPQRLRDGQEATVTVMFCDIRRFSKFAEQLSPSETIRWVADVMEQLSQRILDGGGTLVDFVGDEVMAMWGAPQARGDHAEAAARCALEIQEVVGHLSQKWHDVLGDVMQVGIGIHTGIVSVGNTGSPQRFKYGPLGNTVNLGSRVQGASKYLRSAVLVTRDTRRQLPRDFHTRRLCSVRVANIDRPVDIYELAGQRTEVEVQRDARYEQALAEFESGRFDAAVVGLAHLLTEHPQDGPSLLLMSRLIDAKLSGDTEFDPVWRLPGK